MDQFEAARLKHAKNHERNQKYLASLDVPAPLPQAEAAVPVVPSEKAPSRNCIIRVTVELPDGEFSFMLVKSAVYQNVNRGRMNASELKRGIQNGLRPLMGELT